MPVVRVFIEKKSDIILFKRVMCIMYIDIINMIFIFLMFDQILLIDNKVFLLIRNTLLDMTINNPIFIFAIITVIWFIPGIIVRRFNEIRQIKKKEKIQAEAIEKLYPKSKN